MAETALGDLEATRDMLDFVREGRTAFHVTAEIARRLERAGFEGLSETDGWGMGAGDCRYAIRNGSSLIAWRVGRDLDARRFQITAAHSDSPCFKVKPMAELEGPAGSLRLNVEAYGGMIDHSWFDRPLGLAGRAVVASGDRVESRLVSIDRPVAVIPSLAIHMDREVNKGFAPNRQVDLCPLVSWGGLGKGAVDALVAEAVDADPADVLARDLYLVNLQEPLVWGAADEFVSAPRLDDLMCAHASLEAFLSSDNPGCISVYCCFDNEEVGSNTKQGALSTFLRDTLERVGGSLGWSVEELRRAIAASVLVSCDNAHAVHPNHPEKADEGNRCSLNGGLVIKEAANQAYCTDGFSRALIASILKREGIPFQTFSNRSDMAGGSTLGNLSNTQVSLHAVDVGCPQLAMHSSFETAGSRDVGLAIRALRAFFDADIRLDGAASALLP
ncbi:MAG: M18 family aminopeptidase [Collinsella sp.]|nr:M18 family aminopeptidase [Collinsella sp.]